MDNRSAYVNKLQGELHMAFPQYLGIFSKVTTNTSLTLLETYTSPDAFIEADKQEIVDVIKSTARFGLTYANNKYHAIIQAAHEAQAFGYIIDSNIRRIRLYISFIRKYDVKVQSKLTLLSHRKQPFPFQLIFGILFIFRYSDLIFSALFSAPFSGLALASLFELASQKGQEQRQVEFYLFWS